MVLLEGVGLVTRWRREDVLSSLEVPDGGAGQAQLFPLGVLLTHGSHAIASHTVAAVVVVMIVGLCQLKDNNGICS